MATAFQYTTVLDGEKLRLLEPVKITSKEIRFNLIEISRETSPAYTAVSYTWGSQIPTDVVFLNGKPFPVRANLWSCLYYLSKDPNRTWRHLWVDAICIDQTMDAEKSHQVKFMDRTYREARCVSVWLGLPRGLTFHSPSTHPPPSVKHETACAVSKTEDEFDWQNEIWEDLGSRSYWHRIWVIQELVLATEARVHCGGRSITLKQFSNHLYSRKKPVGKAHFATTMMTVLWTCRDETAAGTMLQLLYWNGYRMASDARDYVFAMLNIANDATSLKTIFPDYSMPPRTVAVIALAYVLDSAPVFFMANDREIKMRAILDVLRGFRYSNESKSYQDQLLHDATKIQAHQQLGRVFKRKELWDGSNGSNIWDILLLQEVSTCNYTPWDAMSPLEVSNILSDTRLNILDVSKY